MAELRGGTSGYAYKEWKGSFYPEKLPDREMLGFYGQQLRTVEINHTFYRIPTEKVLEAWAESVPLGFHFVLKANQKITHIQQLRDCRETLRRFLETASVLARRELLGPILFQLPPTFRPAAPPPPRRSGPPGGGAARPGSGRAWTSTFSSSMKTPGRPRPTRAGS